MVTRGAEGVSAHQRSYRTTAGVEVLDFVGYYIAGWVEVQDLYGYWEGAIRVGPVLRGGEQPMWQYLFGAGRRGDLGVPPVAAGRGYPQDISREALKEVLGDMLEEDFDMAVALSLLRDDHRSSWPTHISYGEIEALNPTDFIGPKHRRLRIMDDQWRRLFRLMVSMISDT